MAIPSSRFVPSSLSGSSTYTTTPKIIGPIIVYVVLVGDPGLLVIFSLDLIKTKQVQVKPFKKSKDSPNLCRHLSLGVLSLSQLDPCYLLWRSLSLFESLS